MKTESNDIARIRSFNEIRLNKAKLKYELAYQEKRMLTDLTAFGETVKRSILFSLREVAQDVTSILVTKLFQLIMKRRSNSDERD